MGDTSVQLASMSAAAAVRDGLSASAVVIALEAVNGGERQARLRAAAEEVAREYVRRTRTMPVLASAKVEGAVSALLERGAAASVACMTDFLAGSAIFGAVALQMLVEVTGRGPGELAREVVERVAD